jgi:23S rRNA (cytosine1962-C5)-methyltransferase
MELLKPQIRDAVLNVFECDTLIFKNDGAARELEGLPSYVEAAKGKLDETGMVIEGGLRFEVPLAEGQKTGWFFDQAANRRALTKYVRKGARVLDVFSYVGAWGARAARDGAGEVTCVDSSAAALDFAVRNAGLNSLKMSARKGDAFDVLEALARERAEFDIVVIHPPSRSARRICQRRSPPTNASISSRYRCSRTTVFWYRARALITSPRKSCRTRWPRRRAARKGTCKCWKWAARRRIIRCTRRYPRPGT